MVNPALIVNTLGTTGLALNGLRSSRLRSSCKDLLLSWMGRQATSSGVDATSQDKIEEAFEDQRVERVCLILDFLKRHVDGLLAAMCLFWVAQIGRTPEAWNDGAVACRFVFLACLICIPCTSGAFGGWSQVITKETLRIGHSMILVALIVYQISGIGHDNDRALHSLLRAIVGVVISDFGFCSASNLIGSISLCIGLLSRYDIDHCKTFATSEAQLLAWLTASLWASQIVFRRLAESSSELRASLEAQRAMWSLLESQYDAVVHVGYDLRVFCASTRFQELIGSAASQGDSPADAVNNPSGDVSASSGHPPMASGAFPSHGSKALRGHLWTEFLASNSERIKLQQRMEKDDQGHAHQSEVHQVSLHNNTGKVIPVSFYHSRFGDSHARKTHHLIGLRVKKESPGDCPIAALTSAADKSETGGFDFVLKPPSSDTAPGEANLQLPMQTTAALCRLVLDSMSQGAVLVFDIMDPDLRILGVSDKWTSLFGIAEGNLPVWLGPRLVTNFKEWVAGKLREAVSGQWTKENSKHKFRRVAGRYPNGAKLTTTISLIMLNPAEYFNANERSYIAMLLAESTGARATGGSSRSSRSYRSGCGNLATVAEEDENQGKKASKRSKEKEPGVEQTSDT